MIIKCKAIVARMIPELAEFEFDFDTEGDDYLEDYEYHEWIQEDAVWTFAEPHFKRLSIGFSYARREYFTEESPSFEGELVKLEMDLPKARSKTPPREIEAQFQVQPDGSLVLPHEFTPFPIELATQIKGMDLVKGKLYKVIAKVKSNISGTKVLSCEIKDVWLGDED